MRIILILQLAISLEACGQLRLTEVKNWTSDVIDLKAELVERHVDIYREISKEEYDQLFDQLINDIPSLERHQVLVRISQIFARIGDGHTSFFPGDQRRMRFNLYPIKFWTFSDGIYVTSTTADYHRFLGRKLIAIENTPISDVIELVSSTISADNEMEHIYSVPFSLAYAETLQALDITKSAEFAEFHFENGSATVHGMKLKDWQYADYVVANSIYPDGKSPSQRVEALFASRLTRDSLKFQRRRMFYWYKYLEQENAMFLQYNVCWDQKERPRFATMIQNIFEEIDQKKVERLIIDLRQNAGGEPKIAQPLMDELKKRKKYVDEGRVFVLVGRRTYSAALTNAAHLRKLGVKTVGEPPRGKPNNPSEGRDINLKRTKIWGTVSTQFVTRDSALRDAMYLPIDLPVEMTIDDFVAGKDAALEMALRAPFDN